MLKMKAKKEIIQLFKSTESKCISNESIQIDDNDIEEENQNDF